MIGSIALARWPGPVALLLLAAMSVALSCSSRPVVAPADNPLCAFDCPPRGLAQGNAAISGVPGADAYFGAVVAYETAAEHVSASLEAQLAQVHTAFGIPDTRALGAEIKRLGATLLAAEPSVVAGSAACWVDSQRLLAMQGQCDPDFQSPGTIDCRGPCRVDPSADCGHAAKLECTLDAPGVSCSDLCSGVCRDAPDQAGKCTGTCLGACTGTCDRFDRTAVGALRCAGRCVGTCNGQCDAAIDRGTCPGTCFGQCTSISPDMCTAPIEARCQPDPGQLYKCAGTCAGVYDAPRGKAECRAAAKAQAGLLARCEAPWVSVYRALAETTLSADQQSYLNGLHELQLRFPELLATIARAKLIKSTGEALATVATGDVKQSLLAQRQGADQKVQTQAGLVCALAEVDRVSTAISPAGKRLAAVLAQSDELRAAFGVQ